MRSFTPRPRYLSLPLAALVALTPLAAHAAPAEPVESELFDSWVGRYQDIDTPALLKHLGVRAPLDERLSFSPSQASYYQRVVNALGLGPVAKQRLEDSGMVLVQDPRNFSMAAAYYELYTKDLPLLVTTDSILDAMHRSFDDILAELEETTMSQALMRALRRVQLALPDIAKATPELREACHDLDLYLTVALNLLEAAPDHGRLMTAPRLVAPADVLAILSKVASLQLENPDFGTGATIMYGDERAVDWSQFKPRGHYTKSESLAQYFRAMMWLGRADTGFLFEKPRQLRAAALMTQTLETTGAAKELQLLKDIVDFMVGRSDDLSPAQLAGAMRGLKLVSPSDLVSSRRLEQLGDAVAASGLGQQRIRSQLVVSDPRDPAKVPPPPVFQPFGQRFVLDSFVLSKVVYDDIIYKGVKQERRMPTGLDVMAALGSPLATWLLAVPGGELDRWHYGANLAALRDVVAAWQDQTWSDNLYSLWLDALRTLSHTPTGQHVPELMKRGSWQAKMLQTQLASWAELRHDTILYAKQSYTASVGCLYPEGYVEPYPDFYSKLGRFATEAARRFAALSGPGVDAAATGRYSDYFKNFAKTMATLAGIAKKELAGKALSSADNAFLGDTIERRDTAGGYAPEPDWSGWYVSLVYGDDDDAIRFEPTIADVHTDPDAMRVLEVGTGDVDFAVVAIDNDGDRAIHVGPTFTYYEFTHPAADRLTDEQWTQRLGGHQEPPRPDWIQPWLVDGTR